MLMVIMLINFVYPLDWAMGSPDIWSRLFWMFLWGYFWIWLIFKLEVWVMQIAPPKAAEAQSVEGLKRIKRLNLPQVTTNSFYLTACKPGHQLSFCLRIWTETLAVPGSQACQSLSRNNTIASPGSQAFRLGLELNYQLCWVYNCWVTLKSLRLFHLHYHRSVLYNKSIYMIFMGGGI